MRNRVSLFFALLALCAAYHVGTGIYDITGTPAEYGMMGYAMVDQTTRGIHFRLRARAYIFAEDNARVVYVNVDLAMVMESVKVTVAEKLQKLYPGIYDETNIMISATHTHSGPGGFSWYALYDMTTFGFSTSNFKTIVDGIVQAVVQAHESMRPNVKLTLSEGPLTNANRNRSPTSYPFNPYEEREQYSGDTDTTMTVLRMDGDDGEELGAIAWFPVHCTSMNNTNRLISGDNKGYASYLFEKLKNGKALAGHGKFVAAFGQSNEGDVSPNIMGAHCPDGSECAPDSTCGGKTQTCIASGPGKTDKESTKIIGERQFNAAVKLYDAAATPVAGPIGVTYTRVDMSNTAVITENGEEGHTCPPAMGDSFAAGTTDGPGDFNFKQGTKSPGNPFWNWIAGFIGKPDKSMTDCQAPKPILLDLADAYPHPWVPTVLPLQVARVGQLVLVAVPGEFTTMSGRRLRKTVKDALVAADPTFEDATIVIAGLANAYSSYITTFEEYQNQRYEAASTLYGPHTLAAYQQEFAKLATALAKGEPVPIGPSPPAKDLASMKNFHPGVLLDTAPLGHSYGDVYADVEETYHTGMTVEVEFWSAHPNNNFQTQDSYLYVQQSQGNGEWKDVLTDGDWDTAFRWRRHGVSESIVTITWEIGEDTLPGVYRIMHKGASKSLAEKVKPFIGYSREFSVRAASPQKEYFRVELPAVETDLSSHTVTLSVVAGFVAVVVIASAVVAVRRRRRDTLETAYQQVNP